MSDHEPAPPRDGGPYSGDGTVSLVAAYFSFDIAGEQETIGHMGGHCHFHDWTLEPPSALLQVPTDQSVPAQVVMREIHPDEDDLDQVSHFGTAPVPYWDDLTFTGAFDREQVLGTFSWEGGAAMFDGTPIPQEQWLVMEFSYDTEDAEGRAVGVQERLHLRDLGSVPVELDREDKMCD